MSAHATLLAALLVPLTGQADPPAPRPAVELHAVERNLVKFTNQQRRRHGRAPLEICPELMRTARRHAAWMTRTRRFRHTWRDPVAENIARGQRTSRDAVAAWMNSAGHRANLLSSSHRRIGVAAYVASDGSVYWCQQFR